MTPLETAETVSVIPEMLPMKDAFENPMLSGTSAGFAPVAVVRSAFSPETLGWKERLGPT
jgi:hypothetical protein